MENLNGVLVFQCAPNSQSAAVEHHHSRLQRGAESADVVREANPDPP